MVSGLTCCGSVVIVVTVVVGLSSFINCLGSSGLIGTSFSFSFSFSLQRDEKSFY